MTTAAAFAAKWQGSTRTERAAAQEHFIDLCRLVGAPTPNEADPTGAWYAFEKGVAKSHGGDGFADVWKKGHFAWEYKGKRKDLSAAYQQLLQYREALDNPPCLVVCDLDRFEVRTNFTGTKTVLHSFTLTDLLNAPTEPLRVLRSVMLHPDSLRPTQTRDQVTEEAASRFAALAEKLRARGHSAQAVAHFLNRLLFCFFAEDVGLLPRNLVTRLIEATKTSPSPQLRDLFRCMHAGGGYFGTEPIEWFNGGLFDDEAVLPLEKDDLSTLLAAGRLDWSAIEPAILGTLFERGLDPAHRSQLGAHYTDKAAILRVVEPVVLSPLRQEFEAVRARIEKLLATGKKPTAQAKGKNNPVRVFRDFLDRLRAVRVLDPACGSGNFLYVTLGLLKDLEKEVILWGARALSMPQEFPGIGPEAVLGIELNPYAAELARVTIWIGEIQWMVNNGFAFRTDPVLRTLDTVACRDALIDLSDPTHPTRANWPTVDFIVGNPPFLGGKQMRAALGDTYVDALFAAWSDDVPREADFVCYWHEASRAHIERSACRRAGLLATQGIRTGANQRVLKRIKETGDLFLAWSDQPWVVNGADVRISIVGQDDGTETRRLLNGAPVEVIHANLTGGATSSADVTTATRLAENASVAFMGDTKGGAFDIQPATAAQLLAAGPNPNGRPNSDVIVPWMNAADMTRRSRGMFIIDFGTDATETTAAAYEAPFELLRSTVLPERAKNKRASYAQRWWLHVEPRPALRAALAPLSRFLITPRTSKHRLFAWTHRATLPDCQLITIARDDDYTFGILHSRLHETWSLATVRRQGVGNDPVYAPSFAFETFPFPWPLNQRTLTTSQTLLRDAVSAAAKSLEEQRSRWLNPPELTHAAPNLIPDLPPLLLPTTPEAALELRKRTLTNLYNTRPGWLTLAHKALDAAVFAAYGWPPDLSDDEILARLLTLNHERSA